MIDSHFHALSLREKGLDPVELLARCFQEGFRAALDVAVDTDDFEERRALLAPFTGVFLTAGISPFRAGSPEIGGRLQRLEAQLASPRVLAVGEIGIDRHWNYGTPEGQRELFTAQVEMAAAAGLPIVVHNRAADGELLGLLSERRPPRGGIMHCFSSDYPAALQFIERGFLISFAGNVTYKGSEPIQEAARRIPGDSLLVETDSPYLAPLPHRGRPCDPSLVSQTYAFVAQLRGITIEELVERVWVNFSRLFCLG